MRRLDLLASLVIAAVAVLALAVAAGFVLAGDGASPDGDAEVDKRYYTSEDLVESADLVEGSGSIDVQPGEKTILIKHSGSGAAIEPVTQSLVEAGHEVRFYQPGQGQSLGGQHPLNASLAEADAFLIVGANGFSSAAVDGIEAFADAGGRVLVAHDATAGLQVVSGVSGAVATGGSGGAELLSAFGVDVGEGYLYNMAENDQNYQRIFASADGGRLVEGVDRLVIDTGSPLATAEASPIVTTGEQTHYSVDRQAGSYTVAAQTGNVVVLGDTAMFGDLNHDRADNNVFLGNLLTYLTSATKTPDNAPIGRQGGPTGPQQPPQPPQTPPSSGSAP